MFMFDVFGLHYSEQICLSINSMIECSVKYELVFSFMFNFLGRPVWNNPMDLFSSFWVQKKSFLNVQSWRLEPWPWCLHCHVTWSLNSATFFPLNCNPRPTSCSYFKSSRWESSICRILLDCWIWMVKREFT